MMKYFFMKIFNIGFSNNDKPISETELISPTEIIFYID